MSRPFSSDQPSSSLSGLERTKSQTSSYHDPEFVPEVHLSPITSRASRRDTETGLSDAETRSTRVAPEAGEKGYIEVTWDGPGDRCNPLNMKAWRKW